MTKIEVRVVDSYVFRQTENGIVFLLLKRADTKQYEHLWQGVAGKIERDESAHQTVIRELKEETGLLPKRMFTADHVSRFYESHSDRLNLVPVFGIEVESDEVQLSVEHIEFRWVDVEEALKLLVWKGQKEAIQTIHEMITADDNRIRWSELELKH